MPIGFNAEAWFWMMTGGNPTLKENTNMGHIIYSLHQKKRDSPSLLTRDPNPQNRDNRKLKGIRRYLDVEPRTGDENHDGYGNPMGILSRDLRYPGLSGILSADEMVLEHLGLCQSINLGLLSKWVDICRCRRTLPCTIGGFRNMGDPQGKIIYEGHI